MIEDYNKVIIINDKNEIETIEKTLDKNKNTIKELKEQIPSYKKAIKHFIVIGGICALGSIIFFSQNLLGILYMLGCIGVVEVASLSNYIHKLNKSKKDLETALNEKEVLSKELTTTKEKLNNYNLTKEDIKTNVITTNENKLKTLEYLSDLIKEYKDNIDNLSIETDNEIENIVIKTLKK